MTFSTNRSSTWPRGLFSLCLPSASGNAWIQRGNFICCSVYNIRRWFYSQWIRRLLKHERSTRKDVYRWTRGLCNALSLVGLSGTATSAYVNLVDDVSCYCRGLQRWTQKVPLCRCHVSLHFTSALDHCASFLDAENIHFLFSLFEYLIFFYSLFNVRWDYCWWVVNSNLCRTVFASKCVYYCFRYSVK